MTPPGGAAHPTPAPHPILPRPPEATARASRTGPLAPLLLAAAVVLSLAAAPPGARAQDAAPSLGSSTSADCVVTFNEVMYHPLSEAPGLEWIELLNQMSVDVDLSDWSLTGGVDYRFPRGTTLRAGATLVIAANPSALEAASGLTSAFGPFSGALANQGERLVLRNLNDRVMDELSYADQPPWPVGADGSGASLAKITPASPSSPAAHWRASREIGGTPGQPNFPDLAPPSEPVVDTQIGPTTRGRWLVPDGPAAGTQWTTVAYDDTTWTVGTNGFGFDRSNAPPLTRPARYYPLETDFREATATGLDGTPQGSPAFVADHPVPASDSSASARFNGQDQAATLPEPIVPTAYSVSLWVKLATVNSCTLAVLTSGAGPTTHWSHQLRLNGSGQFEHYTFDGGWNTVTSHTVAQPGRWYHLAATAENGGAARLFVDGIEQGTPDPVGTLWTGGDRWMLGSNSGQTPNFLDGWLDSVAIWHEVIPASQIAALAAGSSPLAGGGLKGLFATDLTAPLWGHERTLQLRVPFTEPAGVTRDQLLLRIRYNDGFVAWLNGTEVARRNAPDAPAWNSNATAARTPGASAVPETLDLTPSVGLLRPGPNVLAVLGLKRGADDDDFLVQLDLAARRGAAPAAGPGLALSELPPAGTSPFWCELANASSQPVSLADCSLRDSQGRALALDGRVLDPGELTVVSFPPTNAPPRDGDRLFLVSAAGSRLQDAVRVAPHPQARAQPAADQPWLSPSRLTPGAENAFALHDEIVINEVFYHAPPQYRRPGTPPETASRTLLAWDARWRFEQSGQDLGTAWRAPDYDDARWAAGPGILGFRTGALAEPIRTPLTPGRWTYYFRVPFVLEDVAAATNVQMHVLVDDGAVFYLNGAEIYRQKMPDGTIGYSTPATNVGDPPVTGPHRLPPARLVTGTNWLAAEVHQWHLDSSDLVCGAQITAIGAITPGTPGTPFAEDDQQWVELLNRSDHPVDLTGWRLTDAIDFTLPAGTTLGAGDFLVVARQADALRSSHPGIAVLGDFSRRLSHRSDRIALVDAAGNPVDEVRYHDDPPWPSGTDGGGSSLELRDASADNSAPSAWAASDESSRSVWQRHTVTARAVEPVFGPPLNGFSELRLGLLDDGECLLDNFTVIEDPEGTRRSLLQNGSFSSGPATWRLLGNHSHSRVEPDPDQPANAVLHLVATDARGYLHNQIESTLKSGAAVVPVTAGRMYEISFDARWLRGSPQLHVELYYNRVARTVILPQPASAGTPGRRNSTAVDNLGPTYARLRHAPPVPKPGEPITLSVIAQDPDGLETLVLHYAVQEGAWQQTPMQRAAVAPTPPPDAPALFTATLPPQASPGAVIQFYVRGTDRSGAASLWPAAGRDARALLRVDNRTAGSKRRPFHLILVPRDGALLDDFQNMMSDDRLGATVVWDNREIFYDCGVHLHGSMFSRNNPDTAAYNVRFPADQPFRGVHRTVQLKRRVIQEIIAKHVHNQSGVPGMYDDIVQLFSHRPGNAGPARISLAHFNDVYLDSQYDRGSDGMLLNLEGIRVAMATHDGTPEGVKLPFPIDWVANYDITDLGDDPEQYRWTTMIRNNRARDDHSRYLALAKAFSLDGAALQQAVPEVMDVDEWLRLFALLSLFGIGDTYTQGNPHNLNLYVRPSDQRVLAFPYDWDFFFALDPSAPLWGNQNLSKIISLPVYTRAFHGHLLDLMETTFHTDYLTPWVTHYGSVADEDYRYVLDRVRARSTYVRSRLPQSIPFAITSNGGADFTVTDLAVQLEGRAWIDVRRIRLAGQPDPLPLTWLDATRWQVAIPLATGTNALVLEALNRRGEPVGRDSIAIITTAVDDSQRASLRITELMYHPAPPTPDEREAGFTDADDFEFIELANLGPAEVGLDGVRVDRGVTFDFTASPPRTLGAHARLLITRNPAAARRRYGEHLPIAGAYAGGLDNGGETLRLIDRYGFVIQEFAYDDEGDWPGAADGLGASLENLDPAGDPGLAGHWQASPLDGGSPGQPEFVAPTILAVTLQGNRCALRFEARAGQPYRLLASPATSGAAWTTLQTLPPPAARETIELADPQPVGTEARFYRLVSP